MGLLLSMALALLQLSLLPAGIQSVPVENIPLAQTAESAHGPHHLLPRSLPDKKTSANEFQSFLEWKEVNPPQVQVPKDAVTVFEKTSKQTLYVARLEDCKPCFYDSAKKTCWAVSMHGSFNIGTAIRNQKISFLVNKDNFEILEWKKSSFGEIPPLPVETCDGYFIARNNLGLGYITVNTLITLGDKKQDTTDYEVLTLNHDIRKQLLTVTEYQTQNAKTSENVQLLKRFMASNKNCEPAKQQVKLDQGIDKTIAFLKSHTNTIGGTADTTVTGKIPLVVDVGGKLGLKYDHSRLNSRTTTMLEKNLHSISVEVQVPPNQVCSIDIKSNTFTADVPYSGQLTRIYKNNEIRQTTINDVYSHQEVAEIQVKIILTLLPALPNFIYNLSQWRSRF